MKQRQRKQKQRAQRQANRERYLINRRHWCSVGPPVVMEEPTEAHVKGLLMEWLTGRGHEGRSKTYDKWPQRQQFLAAGHVLAEYINL